MATAVPPAPAELDIHKQRGGEAGPSGLVNLHSTAGSTSSSGTGTKLKREGTPEPGKGEG